MCVIPFTTDKNCKELQQTLSAMLEQIFKDLKLSAMLLQQWVHRSVIPTRELSNVLLNPLAERRPDDVILTSV